MSNPAPNNLFTALAAALAFALVACQPDTSRIDANAAESRADLVAVQEDEEESESERDEPEEEPEAAVAATGHDSEAAATEQATAAADDALIDTREGGNPLIDAPVAVAPEEDDEGAEGD